MSKDRSGPAFPADEYYDEKLVGQSRGMTLRDYFAGQALVGILAQGQSLELDLRRAMEAYALADAMLEARKKP